MKVVSAFVKSEFDWMHLCVLSICYGPVTAHTLYLYDPLVPSSPRRSDIVHSVRKDLDHKAHS